MHAPGKSDRWIPLEMSPEVLNKYARSLGAEENLEFVDVLGFEPEMLKEVPRPVYAVMMLSPEDRMVIADLGEEMPESDEVFFMQQTFDNSSCTVGLIHSLSNSGEKLLLDSKKHLKRFLHDTKKLNPEERGKFLECDSAFGMAHDLLAQEGQSARPSGGEATGLNSVTFVHRNGKLIELNGRRKRPVKHCPTTEDSLLEDCVGVMKKYMAANPDNPRFTVVALTRRRR